MLKGIDVSRWNGVVDWPAVAADGASFAICKASEGITHKDKRFIENWNGAKAAGLVVGAYHFYKFRQAGDVQAENFLSQIYKVWYPGDPALFAVDLEWNPTDDPNKPYIPPKGEAELALEFVRIVEHDLKRPMLVYTAASFWQAAGNPEGFTVRPLWVSNFTNAAAPKMPKGWADWLIWQYAADAETGFPGKIAGVKDDVDLNRFRGTVAELEALAGGITTPGADIVEPRPGPELVANATAEVQRALNKYAGPLGFAPLKVDGIAGPKTRDALSLALGEKEN